MISLQSIQKGRNGLNRKGLSPDPFGHAAGASAADPLGQEVGAAIERLHVSPSFPHSDKNHSIALESLNRVLPSRCGFTARLCMQPIPRPAVQKLKGLLT